MAGLVPAIPEGPAHRRRQARKALRPSAFLPVAPRRDSFLRRPGVDGRDKPGHDGKGSTNEQQTGRPTDNAIRAKSRALIALAVVGEGIGSMAEVADGAIKASWPGLSRPSPKAQRIYAGKREKPCDRPPSCRSRRGGTRSCGGPAWMAGTSPAMTARVANRQTGPPTDNAIRANKFLRKVRSDVMVLSSDRNQAMARHPSEAWSGGKAFNSASPARWIGAGAVHAVRRREKKEFSP